MRCFRIYRGAWLLLPALMIPPVWGSGERQDSAPAAGSQGDLAAVLQVLRGQIEALKGDYEQRIKTLEARVEELQLQMLRAAPAPEAAIPQAPSRAVQTSPGILNPAIAVVGNFVARGDSARIFSEDGGRLDNKMSLREAEIDFRVPVDPYADAVLIAAFGAETPGRYSADIEEAYVNIKKLPFMDRTPLGLKLKVGRFRPAFGLSNILHTHDLPQSMRPLPVQEFLGEEGFIQSGLSGNFFLPTFGDRNSSLDATLQVLTGGDVAVSPALSSRTSYLGHLRWYRTLGDANSLQVGWSSYYHPAGNDAARADFHGLDVTYRWKPLRLGEWRSFLLGGELMFARRAYPEALLSPEEGRALEGLQPGMGKPLGITVFGQWQFSRRMYAGARWDQTDVLYDPALQRRSMTPYFSYYFSEFLRFRLNYEHRWSDLFTEDGRRSVVAELNFVFGSHPPEPFWVNK